MHRIIVILFAALGVYLSAAEVEDVDCSKFTGFVDPRTCCTIPDMIIKEMRDICKEFDSTLPMEEVSSTATLGRHPQPHPCMLECVFNETQIFAHGELDEDHLREYLNLVMTDAGEMITVMTESFHTCAAKAKAFRLKAESFPHPPLEGAGRLTDVQCDPLTRFIMGCAYRESFKNCPDNMWNNTEQCNQLRAFMRSCKRSRVWAKHGPDNNRAP